MLAHRKWTSFAPTDSCFIMSHCMKRKSDGSGQTKKKCTFLLQQIVLVAIYTVRAVEIVHKHFIILKDHFWEPELMVKNISKSWFIISKRKKSRPFHFKGWSYSNFTDGGKSRKLHSLDNSALIVLWPWPIYLNLHLPKMSFWNVLWEFWGAGGREELSHQFKAFSKLIWLQM